MKILVILSGGLDSSVLVGYLQSHGHEVSAVSFDYGQRHRKELHAAQVVAATLGVKHSVIDITDVGRHLGMNALLGGGVPHGHYAEESMKATVVPNRNMIMLSIAAGKAMAEKLDAVAYAAHAGDHTIYPDCRPEFGKAMDTVIGLADWTPMNLIRPFIKWTKARIVRYGEDTGIPLEKTWSCYEGGEKHCGLCGTCVERKEAFTLNGLQDPTEYANASL